VAPGVHTRLLSEEGAVVVGLPLSEAFTQMPAAEQYASIPTSDLIRRSEVDSALNGTPATAIRRVFDNQRVLYAAAPVYAENGQISGIVYIATPLPAAGLPTYIILQLVGAVLVAVLLATFAGRCCAQDRASAGGTCRSGNRHFRRGLETTGGNRKQYRRAAQSGQHLQ
jgi:hypothetical protein